MIGGGRQTCSFEQMQKFCETEAPRAKISRYWLGIDRACQNKRVKRQIWCRGPWGENSTKRSSFRDDKMKHVECPQIIAIRVIT